MSTALTVCLSETSLEHPLPLQLELVLGCLYLTATPAPIFKCLKAWIHLIQYHRSST